MPHLPVFAVRAFLLLHLPVFAARACLLTWLCTILVIFGGFEHGQMKTSVASKRGRKKKEVFFMNVSRETYDFVGGFVGGRARAGANTHVNVRHEANEAPLFFAEQKCNTAL